MAISKISIKSIQLPVGRTLVATSYQIATDGRFDPVDIVEDIVEDPVNLLDISFDLDYSLYDIYYARVKLHFDDGGFYGWARPMILTKDGDGFSHTNAVIVTPGVATTTDHDNAELGGFNILGGEFVLFSGTGSHKATSWSIKDTSGNEVWGRSRDKHNLTKVRVPNNILDPRRLYSIEVTYISDGNMQSNAGKLLLKTSGDSPLVEEVEFGDKRVSYEQFRDLEQSYNDLLEFAVNELTLKGNGSFSQPI